MKDSRIAWTDHTFNPWRGCTKVSAGCTNCYAETLSKRNPAVLGTWGPDGTRVIASESYWREPLKWNRDAAREGVRRRVFCASLADWLENRPDLIEPRTRLLDLITHPSLGWLDWLLLTKRPENFRPIMEHLASRPWGDYGRMGIPGSQYVPDHARRWLAGMHIPPNVWLGVSVEDQKTANERIPFLLQIPAAVRFVSYEPALGAVDFTNIRFDNALGNEEDWDALDAHGASLDPSKDGVLHWVIVGGESGSHARPFDLGWARSVRDQCKAAGVACFVKQLGAHPVAHNAAVIAAGTSPRPVHLRDRAGADPYEWPEDLIRVRQFPEPA
jgi:protein gp37